MTSPRAGRPAGPRISQQRETLPATQPGHWGLLSRRELVQRHSAARTRELGRKLCSSSIPTTGADSGTNELRTEGRKRKWCSRGGTCKRAEVALCGALLGYRWQGIGAQPWLPCGRPALGTRDSRRRGGSSSRRDSAGGCHPRERTRLGLNLHI